MEAENKKYYRNPPGRRPSTDPAKHRYYFKLTEDEKLRFEELYLKSGLKERSKFIRSVIFGREIKVLTFDMNARDVFLRLTDFLGQYRRIGNNYNQTVRAIKANFGEKRALSMLYRLEKATMELVVINKQIHDIARKFEERWLPK